MDSLQPKLSQFGPAMAWLMEKGVSPSQLAALFATTPGNIRVLAHRAWKESHRKLVLDPRDLSFSRESSQNLFRRLPIQSQPGYTPTRKMTDHIDWLEREILSRAVTYRRQYRFLEAADSLRQLLPRFGYPANTQLIGLLARLHQYRAWFFVHSGFSSSALAETKLALQLSTVAYREREGSRSNRVYGQQFVDAALIGAMAFLLSRSPDSAWDMLEVAEDASEQIGISIGSDQYRQRGIVLFQYGNRDDEARKFFQNSATTMQRLGEARAKPTC